MSQFIDRIFLIVLDSFGIGSLPDAIAFGDAGANTLRSVMETGRLQVPTMASLGLFSIDGVNENADADVLHKIGGDRLSGCFARLAERSAAKDTTAGHWEIAGLVSTIPFPTYPQGFPPEIIDAFERQAGVGTLCNRPYSGIQVIHDYGREHLETGKLIVYTSADSVFQIAAHEKLVPVETLYQYCEIARKLLQGRHGVGRVIARPFTGSYPDFTRTANRHDFSLPPFSETMLDLLQKNGFDTIGVGKIQDIFAGKGLTNSIKTSGNTDGMNKTLALSQEKFCGLGFINLVDFDMLYGHRNDIAGYADALNAFDKWLSEFLQQMGPADAVMITADHGCDPGFPSTDHTREYTPLLMHGNRLRQGVNLGTRHSFADIAKTVLELFGVENTLSGDSFAQKILK